MIQFLVECSVCGRTALAIRVEGKPDIPPPWVAVSVPGNTAAELFACDNVVCQRRLMQGVMEEYSAVAVVVRSTVRVPAPPIDFLPMVLDLSVVK